MLAFALHDYWYFKEDSLAPLGACEFSTDPIKKNPH